MPTALAISPHLDDAVFSAGGTLARLAREGWHVVVATVFTASVPDPKGFALACQLDKGLSPEIDYMALRRDEDAVACAAIGATARWLGFPEAPHRGYGSAPALFAGLHGGDTIVEAITPALGSLIEALRPEKLLGPQAIGAHVDHVAVHLALRACGRPTALWADFPYAIRGDLRASPFADDFAGLPEEQARLDPPDAAAKIEATLAYESQIGFQFGGAEAARAVLERSGRVERFVRAGF